MTLWAQDGTRTAGRLLAEVVIEDADWPRQTTIDLDLQGARLETGMGAGLLEGLLAAGMTVVDHADGGSATMRLSVVPETIQDGRMKVSVIVLHREEGRYVLSKRYVVPLEEPSLMDGLIAPMVLVGSMVLAVYLLFTVRSS